MLEVYKGNEATRSYENEFFREFASNLVEMFEQEKMSGMLIGYPQVPESRALNPDSVLITDSRMVLIDFKNHGGELDLPSGEDFATKPWDRGGTAVAGGASVNPFVQLEKQRAAAQELFGAPAYSNNGIACLLCFQQDITLVGEVPGQYQAWFSVCSRYQYLNRIRDILQVRRAHPLDVAELARYFQAKPYRDYFAADLAYEDVAGKADKWQRQAEQCETENQRQIATLQQKLTREKSKLNDCLNNKQ